MTVDFVSTTLEAITFSSDGINKRRPISGTTLSWQPNDSPLGFRTGWLGERKSILGSSASRTFGHISANGGFAGVTTRFDLGKWSLGRFAELGFVSPVPVTGL